MSRRMIDEEAFKQSINTELEGGLATKQNKLKAGENITISEDNTISAASGGLKVLELDVWSHSSGALTEEQYNAIKENPFGIVIKAQSVNILALYLSAKIGTDYLYQNIYYDSNPDKLTKQQVLIDKYGTWTYKQVIKEFEASEQAS